MPLTRPQRSLAFMTVAIVGLSLVSIVALLIGAAAGAAPHFAEGLWPVVRILPLIGLPIGVLLIVVFFVLTAVHRGGAAKGDGK
ncbi:MAG: hypothetical protein JWR53_190 [Glaciihabitans sp.]|nr:hypothetical protein [Glaciihabitans sp.]MCU1533709.1 hypothetical protein [Glaciihabitans sp.]